MAAKITKQKFSEAELKTAATALIGFYEGRKPDGKTDNANRWYPSATERCTCCDSIRSPSRAWPWTLYKHCHSLAHIENAFGAKHDATLYLKRIAKRAGIDAAEDIEAFKEFANALICADQIADAVEEIFKKKVSIPVHKAPRV